MGLTSPKNGAQIGSVFLLLFILWTVDNEMPSAFIISAFVLPSFAKRTTSSARRYVTNLNPDEITQRFHRIVKRLDMDGTRFHDLRHFGASYRHNVLKIPDAIVQADGGWSSDQTLKNIYRHAMDDERLRYSGIVNRSFADLYDTKYDTN